METVWVWGDQLNRDLAHLRRAESRRTGYAAHVAEFSPTYRRAMEPASLPGHRLLQELEVEVADNDHANRRVPTGHLAARAPSPVHSELDELDRNRDVLQGNHRLN